MIYVNDRLTLVACRTSFCELQKLSTAFLCLIRLSSSMLLKLFTIMDFITRNTPTKLWISLREVWITSTRIHIRRLTIPSSFDVRTLRGISYLTPFWNCRGEWGASRRRRYIAASLRYTDETRSYPATIGERPQRIIACGKLRARVTPRLHYAQHAMQPTHTLPSHNAIGDSPSILSTIDYHLHV